MILFSFWFYYFPTHTGSKEERAAFDIAYAHSRKSAYHDKFVIEEEGAITIDILPPSEDVTVGGDVNVEIKVKRSFSFT